MYIFQITFQQVQRNGATCQVPPTGEEALLWLERLGARIELHKDPERNWMGMSYRVGLNLNCMRTARNHSCLSQAPTMLQPQLDKNAGRVLNLEKRKLQMLSKAVFAAHASLLHLPGHLPAGHRKPDTCVQVQRLSKQIATSNSSKQPCPAIQRAGLSAMLRVSATSPQVAPSSLHNASSSRLSNMPSVVLPF